MSVERLQGRLWTQQLTPMNHNPQSLLRTQDLEPVYLENSAFYIFSKESFLKNSSRLTQELMYFEVEGLEGWDIDEPWEWEIASCIARKG